MPLVNNFITLIETCLILNFFCPSTALIAKMPSRLRIRTRPTMNEKWIRNCDRRILAAIHKDFLFTRVSS